MEFTLPPIWRYARSSKDRTIAQINTLKTKVINEGLIRLIIYGSTLNDDRDRIIDTYPTVDNKEITITLQTVCNALLNDHMTDYEIVSLLKS